MQKKPIGIYVEGGKTYTVSGINTTGIVMFDQRGNELERRLFKEGLSKQSFTVPNDCIAVRFLKGKYDPIDREMPTLRGNDLKRFLDRYNYNNHRAKEQIKNLKKLSPEDFKKSMEFRLKNRNL